MFPWWYSNMLFAPDEPGDGDSNEPDPEGDEPNEPEGLGDAGKRAIRAERERATKFENQFKEAEKLRKQLEEKHARTEHA